MLGLNAGKKAGMYQLEQRCLSLHADTLSQAIQISAEYIYEFAQEQLLHTHWLYRFDQQGHMTIDVRVRSNFTTFFGKSRHVLPVI